MALKPVRFSLMTRDGGFAKQPLVFNIIIKIKTSSFQLSDAFVAQFLVLLRSSADASNIKRLFWIWRKLVVFVVRL